VRESGNDSGTSYIRVNSRHHPAIWSTAMNPAMNESSYVDQTFTSLDYADGQFRGMEFESCTFQDCTFSNSDLSGNDFTDCRFIDCNLSMAILTGTSLKNVAFIGCKMTGIDFGFCNDFLFSVNFTRCRLDYTIFFKNDLKKSRFEECSIQEAGFTGSDLSGALFCSCDLSRAIFVRNNLTGADFATSNNYSIDPERNTIGTAVFSYPGVLGLLDKYHIILK